ncbi:MAG: hypothetical protein Q4F72_00835 [Desulfovibrionaceae bacterium]|nr:hypothetical protein [Desulfovibrionaceae bacterium]
MNRLLCAPAARLACGLFLALALMGQPAPAAADNDANAFNTYTGKPLPASRTPQGDEAEILKALGGRPRSIAADTAYRKHSRQELYPCLYGTPGAGHEVLVLLDFASPASRPLWEAVRGAVAKVPASAARVVLFGRSNEAYAMDLTGLAIWAARERPGQAVDYVTWALRRWDEVKAGQRRLGAERVFRDEYDAVVTPKDYPMVFTGMSRFRPAVPEKDQSEVARYVYDAGNVNLFQSTEVCSYYGVEKMPALVVDGKVYTKMTAAELVSLLK